MEKGREWWGAQGAHEVRGVGECVCMRERGEEPDGQMMC